MVVLNLSVLTSVRRIVKIAVRFLHTKTALCDRKDTQSRFAANAARSIVCVETINGKYLSRIAFRFQCRTQHCVCRDLRMPLYLLEELYVSMPHAALCVSRRIDLRFSFLLVAFQCRTQHCVCRDRKDYEGSNQNHWFQCRTQHCVCRDPGKGVRDENGIIVSMPHAALCVSRHKNSASLYSIDEVSMPHAALCVSRLKLSLRTLGRFPFQCRTQHCVCRDSLCTLVFGGA